MDNVVSYSPRVNTYSEELTLRWKSRHKQKSIWKDSGIRQLDPRGNENISSEISIRTPKAFPN